MCLLRGEECIWDPNSQSGKNLPQISPLIMLDRPAPQRSASDSPDIDALQRLAEHLAVRAGTTIEEASRNLDVPQRRTTQKGSSSSSSSGRSEPPPATQSSDFPQRSAQPVLVPSLDNSTGFLHPQWSMHLQASILSRTPLYSI